MSVLLTGLDDELTEIVAARLMAQEDEVRIVLGDEQGRDHWRSLGIHVAVGDLTDDDFVWRACMNVRTVVAGEGAPAGTPEVRRTLAASLDKTDVDRVVVVGAGEPDELVAGVRAAGVSHVVLRVRKRGILGLRGAVDADDLAVAIDAADDLAGEPRLYLDLWEPEAWRQLRLDPPK